MIGPTKRIAGTTTAYAIIHDFNQIVKKFETNPRLTLITVKDIIHVVTNPMQRAKATFRLNSVVMVLGTAIQK
jgi:hypothetical protein